MDKESRMLIAALALLIVVSLGVTFYRSFITKEFDIIPIEQEGTEEASGSVTE